MNILIVDTAANKPYSPSVLEQEALGGTEATVVRVAEALGKLGHKVIVAQGLRKNSEAGHATYRRLSPTIQAEHWDAIIVLRDPIQLQWLRPLYPRTPIYLWCHDLADGWLAFVPISDEHLTIVTVSDFHRTNVTEKLLALSPPRIPRITRVYNPISDDLHNNGKAYNPNKLTFFSSPHKGLRVALEYFTQLLEFNPEFKLYILNPGYIDLVAAITPNVIFVGALPHREAVEHVRESLCVFYPNFIAPETFGLVFAEANAVGTPVVTHNCGAAREVLGNYDQLVNCREPKPVIDKVLKWFDEGRPKVTRNEAFAIANVAQAWEQLLAEGK